MALSSEVWWSPRDETRCPCTTAFGYPLLIWMCFSTICVLRGGSELICSPSYNYIGPHDMPHVYQFHLCIHCFFFFKPLLPLLLIYFFNLVDGQLAQIFGRIEAGYMLTNKCIMAMDSYCYYTTRPLVLEITLNQWTTRQWTQMARGIAQLQILNWEVWDGAWEFSFLKRFSRTGNAAGPWMPFEKQSLRRPS